MLHSRKVFCFYFYYYFYKEEKEKINSALSQSPDHINLCDHMSLAISRAHNTALLVFCSCMPFQIGPAGAIFQLQGNCQSICQSHSAHMYSLRKHSLGGAPGEKEGEEKRKRKFCLSFPKEPIQTVTSLTDNVSTLRQ